jgi:hypothetical protein
VFTIKHKTADGVTRVSSCDRYEKSGSRVTATGRRGGELFTDTIDVGDGEVVFIENERGNTTDTIRGKRNAAA